MELSPSIVIFRYIFPPVFYGFHGWIATKMAIWALFHPYEPWYITCWPNKRIQIPGTPGIFPKRRAKLAQAVAATITDTLLTSEDIKTQAEVLVTRENIFLAVDAFVDSVLRDFSDTTKLHKLADDVAELSPTMLEQLVVSTINGIGADNRLPTIVEKIFDHLILSAKISSKQAELMTEAIMEMALTPSKLRTLLISILTPQNISAIDDSIQAHASTPYKILARIIGVKRVCNEWKNFFEKQPVEAEAIIVDLLKRFGVQKQLSEKIAAFDLASLPVQQVTMLKANLVSLLQSFLVEHKSDILDVCARIENESMSTVRAAIVQFNPASIPPLWLNRAKQDITDFCHQYLEAELGELLEKIIPKLGIYALVARKIDLFTPQQLEKMINRLCEQELNWLAVLGAVIGAWMGLVQIFVNVTFR